MLDHEPSPITTNNQMSLTLLLIPLLFLTILKQLTSEVGPKQSH